MTHHKFYLGNCIDVLKTLPDESVQCCVTSPPYWNLRDYGIPGQFGLEPTPDEYVANMVGVFREVKRVLRKDGTLWLNLGDTYNGVKVGNTETKKNPNLVTDSFVKKLAPGLKPKDLVGIPWMVAFALRDDGWFLRSDIIWHKPNTMPESVTDRPTKSHEYIFLLSKNENYFYDADAIKEIAKEWTGQAATFQRESGKATRLKVPGQSKVSHRPDRKQDQVGKRQYNGFNDRYKPVQMRNKRSVWSLNTKPFSEAHFATFPPEIPEICIKAGCPEGGVVLDPFGGSGTVSMVAARLGRSSIYIDLNPEYLKLALKRCGFNEDRLFDSHSFEVVGM
jgi:DNA modification methylase